MTFKSILSVLLLTTTLAQAQLNIKNPIICHDKDNYLKCYNDGIFILNFENGNFKKLKTVDSTVKYSDVAKTLTVVGKLKSFDSAIDTFEITLRTHSVYIKKGTSTLELTSDRIVPKIYMIGFGTTTVSYDTLENERRFTSLTLHIDGKEFEFKFSTFWKTWSWDIIIRQQQHIAAISYNGYKKNRLEHLFISDDSLKYGTSARMTFRSLKKISELHSLYVDTIMINGKVGYGNTIPLEISYSYRYKKSGRIKTIRPQKDIRRCNCN